MLVSANLLNKKVTEVACGSHHSMALTDSGEVSVFVQQSGNLFKTFLMTHVIQLWPKAVLSHTDHLRAPSPNTAAVDPSELKTYETKLSLEDTVVLQTPSNIVSFVL